MQLVEFHAIITNNKQFAFLFFFLSSLFFLFAYLSWATSAAGRGALFKYSLKRNSKA